MQSLLNTDHVPRLALVIFERHDASAMSERASNSVLFSNLLFGILVLVLLGLCWKPEVLEAAEKKPTKSQVPNIASLAEKLKPSVVVVRQFGRQGRQEGVGTGFVVAKDGLIATCYHVVGEARPISVELADGRKFEVNEVYASDRRLDLAVLRVRAEGLPALKLGDSMALKQGETVLALGNPAGLEQSIVQGIVSARRDFDGIEMIQLAMPIEHGNSGGPLLDLQGRVHGLLNMKSAVTANLGFAIPSSALQSLLDRPNPIPMSRWLNLGALDSAEWKPIMGARWSRRAGRILVDTPGEGFGGRSLCLWMKEKPDPPYEISAMVKMEDESGAAGLVFASDEADRHYGFYPTAGQLRLTRFDGANVFSWSILNDVRTPHYKPGDWNLIRVRVETNRVEGFVNGEKVVESTDARWREGRVGLAKFRDTKAQFREFKLTVGSPKARNLEQIENAVQSLLRPDRSEGAQALVESDADAARPVLLERARKLDQDAHRLRQMASELSLRAVRLELVRLLDQPENQIDLSTAALLVAKLDLPDLDVDAYQAELNRMGQELSRSTATAQDDQSKLDALRRYLFQEQGFHGSRTDFYNRANSYLSEVIEEREGLPITLSVLFLDLARRIGLKHVSGIPVPTRFMVGFKPGPGKERLIDVFDGGKILTRSEAVELVADNVESVGEKDFMPATNREIVTRMIRNLLGISQRKRDTADSLRYLDTLLVLSPDSVPDRLERARIRAQQGNSLGAKEDVRVLLESAPTGIDIERLREWYQTL